MNLFTKFEQTAESHPNKPAFIFFFSHTKKWDVLTYKGLLDTTHRFILGLQACSLTPGLRAAVMTPPSTEFFALAFALLKLGIVPIIVDPAIGLKRVSECLEEAKPDIFIGNPFTHILRVAFGWGKTSIKNNLTINQLLQITNYDRRNTSSPIHHTPNSPAAIIFTSGSTGIPKGVLYTYGNFSAQLDMLQKTFNISPDEIDLPAFPLYAIIDVLLGVTSVIPDINFPVPGKTDPKQVIDAIQKFRVTNMFASPVVLDILASFALSGERTSSPEGVRTQSKHPLALRIRCQTTAAPLRERFASLKRVITAGAPATIPLQERFRKLLNDETDLYGIYGATETLPIALVESREIFSIKEKTELGAGICLGRPVENAKVRIIQITDEPIPQWQDSLTVKSNVIGEITVQGPAVTRSYIHGDEANLQSKIKDGDDIIHRMGDVGYFDEQGRLWYCGRKSHRVITSDGVLFTEQIENIFNAHPSVYRTALVGVHGEPLLWVELEKNARVNKDKIRSELIEIAKHHPQASRIKTFLFMKRFPTDVRHNSKIIREELTAKTAKVAKKISKNLGALSELSGSKD